MKKQLSRGVAFLLVAVMLLSSSAMAVNIIPRRASEYLDAYGASISRQGSGKVAVIFSVAGTGTMDEVGVLNIVLQESTDEKTWSTVSTYFHTDYANMLNTNRISCNSSVSYSGVSGRYYRAYVTVWAGKAGGGDSRDIWTSSVKA